MATETLAAVNVGVAVEVGIEIDTEAVEIGAEIETEIGIGIGEEETGIEEEIGAGIVGIEGVIDLHLLTSLSSNGYLNAQDQILISHLV